MFSIVTGVKRCFELVKDGKTWQDAMSTCTASTQSHLAFDNSTETNEILKSLMKNNTINETWIGGKTNQLYWNWMPTQNSKSGRLKVNL